MSSNYAVKVNESLSSINNLLEKWQNQKENLNALIDKKLEEIAKEKEIPIEDESIVSLKKELFKKYNSIIVNEINELETTKEQLKLCI